MARKVNHCLTRKTIIYPLKITKVSAMDNLKMRFLKAVLAGELGSNDKQGITVTSKEFISYFNDIHSGYVTKFLPAATIEKDGFEIVSIDNKYALFKLFLNSLLLLIFVYFVRFVVNYLA